MRKLPSHISQFDKTNFLIYLRDKKAASIWMEKSIYEVVRYFYVNKDNMRENVQIIYKKINGNLTFTENTEKDYQDFLIYQERKEKEKVS